MKSELDFLIEEAQKEEKYFKNYLKWTKIIKKEVEKPLGKVKVLIFGSVLKKDEVPQDIDILIISPGLKTNEQKSKIRLKIWKKIGPTSPFEIHLITPEEYQNWYQNFIKEKIEV
ncbi:MAG: nucleotidyltransferase domain-containing protein [Candidatus Nealsonbacteria bacterium]|nr:nucleotidyltransferase domain-containing protein [Candidatus Nealsonbacteria bacterium]